MSECRYCSDDPKKLIDNGEFKKIDTGRDAFIDNRTRIIGNKLKVEVDADFNIYASDKIDEVEINFCPMCGRKLEGDKL